MALESRTRAPTGHPSSGAKDYFSETMSTREAIKNHAAFIWSVADLLRGDYKQSEYGKVILPLTVIRRLDCVLEPTKAKVLAVYDKYGDRDQLLRAAAENQFYNTSRLTLASVLSDSAN